MQLMVIYVIVGFCKKIVLKMWSILQFVLDFLKNLQIKLNYYFSFVSKIISHSSFVVLT